MLLLELYVIADKSRAFQYTRWSRRN